MGLVNKFFEYCGETSCHGLNHMKKGKPIFLNGLWGLCFLIALAASLIGIVKVLLLYSKRPMSTDYRIVANQTLELPSMSICAFSYISKTRMRRLGMSEPLQNALYYSMGFDYHEGAARNESNVRELQSLLTHHNLSDFEDLLVKLSISCEEMFSECYMGGHEVDCCSEMRQFLFPARCITFAATGYLPPSEAWSYTVVLNFPDMEEELMASMITARSREFSIMINRGNRAMVGAKTIGYASPGHMQTILVRTRMYESVNNPPVYECVNKHDDLDYDRDSCMERCTIDAHFHRLGAPECPCQSCVTFEARPLKQFANTSDPKYKPLCNPFQLLVSTLSPTPFVSQSVN